MCGRYSIASKAEKLAKRFKVDPTDAYKPHYNASPTQLLPVITSDSPDGLSFFYWGMVPAWSNNKSVSQKLINARAETLSEKATFKLAFQRRRCLIPADGFYEWKAIGKKTKVPYRFSLRQEEPFAFAGIWDEFETSDGEIHHTFVIITTQANDLVLPIHDRMPVLLSPEHESVWLNRKASTEDLLKVLNPYDSDLMKSYTVSPEVNNTHNDYEGLLKHVPPADQHGNYTLFG
jgi:putative SOS response-associated peptidase YedK